MKKLLPCSLSFLFVLFSTTFVYAQKEAKQSRLSLSFGYGAAGSFFVRSYEENQLPGWKTYFKKRFIGSTKSASVGWQLSKNYELRGGINFQHFTRKVKITDTLSSVLIQLDHRIHHDNYIYFVSAHRKISKGNNSLSAGLGLFYIIPIQEEIEISGERYFADIERDNKSYNLADAGSYIELAYLYQFQPKVGLGLKAQYYHNLTAMIAESVTLFPYIKITF